MCNERKKKKKKKLSEGLNHELITAQDHIFIYDTFYQKKKNVVFSTMRSLAISQFTIKQPTWIV